jgi:hypothetical protein
METTDKKKSKAANIIIALIIIVFLAVVIGLLSIDGILRAAIPTAIKTQLKVDASVSKAHLGITSGTIEITNLKIGNPEGYQFENILEANSIFVQTSISGLMGNPVEIQQVKLDNIKMVIEQKGLTSNLNDILKAMPAKDEKKAEPTEADKKSKSVHITSVDISNISVTVKLLPLPGKSDAVTLHIASLHLSDVGGENESLADVIGKIFRKISEEVASQGKDIIPSDVLGSLEGSLGDAGKVLEKAGKETTEKATDALKNIFKKK